MSKEPRLVDDSATHKGCVRTANEDSMVGRGRERVWAVADGMGGHKNGQYASAKVAATIAAAAIPEAFEPARAAVASAIVAANDALFAESRASGEQMGSTVVALVIRDRRFAILWVGDSRAYLLREGELSRLTRDHTQVQAMLDRGLLDQDEAEHHPMGHVLARAVGAQPDLDVDRVDGTTEIGDIFLLCSDGLHGVLTGEEIAGIVASGGSRSADMLVEACLERGAPDNVTVTIVRLLEPTTLSFADSQVAG